VPRHQTVPLQKLKEIGTLIDDAGDAQLPGERAGEQARQFELGHVASRGRDRIAVRIDHGPAEHLVHAGDQSLGNRVLEDLGVLVHLAPVHLHHFDEEELDQTVAAQDVSRELHA
jgi:hypothetical protein